MKQTPEQAALKALLGHAAGIDAIWTGKEFGEDHEAARQTIIKAFQDRAELLSSIDELLLWARIDMPDDMRSRANAVFVKAKS